MAWVIVATSSDKLNLYENGLYSLNTGDGTNNPFQDSSGNTINVLHDDKWHHFAIIFNSNETKLYIDGLYKGNAKTFKDPTTTNEKIVRIGGGYNNTHTYDWNGMLNDFRIYDHALSSMEVKQISQGLVLHYPLNNIGIKEDIEYDCSGYCNNGIRTGNFQYDNDTPKYNVSTVFSASSSVIKIPNSNYAIQGSQNMTISVWAYKEDWSQYVQRIYSCTESGGLNIQNSSSGNMQWAVNVYTDAEKTSHKYASSSPDLYIRVPRTDFSSGWHMFTWVYTTSGTSLYVDGVLKQSKTGTSYGLYFHSTAPLILGGQATSTNYSSPYLDGKLSDFRIYVTALSVEDILALYKNSVYIDNEGNLYGAELREV